MQELNPGKVGQLSGDLKKVTTEINFDSVFKLDLKYGKISSHPTYKVSYLGLC